MDSNDTRTLLPVLGPLLTNPTALAVLGIGAAGWAILKWLSEDKEDRTEPAASNGSEPSIEPLRIGPGTVEDPLVEGYEAAEGALEPEGSPGGGQPLGETLKTVGEPLQPPSREDDDADKNELIRQAMSELGKRSAAARARKRFETV